MSINRRELLKFGSLAGGVLAAPSSIVSASIVGSDSGLEASVFANDGRVIAMNAANLTPMLKPLEGKISHYTRLLNRDVSFINRKNIVDEYVASSKTKVAKMLGVKDELDLAFVRNTSEANSVINNGIDLSAEDEVLLWDQNHPTNLRSWYYRQQRVPFKIKQVQLPEKISGEQDLLDAFMSKITSKTRVVSFTELSNISGLRLPAKMLCEAIHEFNENIFIHVDGAQSWGCLDVNLEEMGCDSFSSSGHKWFMGPRGTGILYVKKSWAQKIWPSSLGYNFSMEYPEKALAEDASRFECIGQRDVAPYATIGDCADLYQGLGGSKIIEQRIQALTQFALNKLDAAGVKTLTPRQVFSGSPLGHGVVIADLGSALSAYGAFLALHNAGIAAAFVSGVHVCCTPRELPPQSDGPTYLRLSPHIYNSREDIEKAVSIIKRINESKFEIIKEVVRFL